MSWPEKFLVAILTLVLAGFLQRLLDPPPGSGKRPLDAVLAFLFLALFAGLALAWLGLPGRDASLRPWLILAGTAGGAAAFRAAGPRPLRAAGLGALAGLLFCAQGLAAGRWLAMAEAWARLGPGPAVFVRGLPLILAASYGLTAAALLHPDFKGLRCGVSLGVLAAWIAVTGAAEWRLRSAWDFGPAGLAQAAGLPAVPRVPELAVAVLRPGPDGPYRVELRRQAVGGLAAVPENLELVERYLRDRGCRTVFRTEGLSFLRGGWLLRWDAQRALEAAALRVPGRAAPDYRGALALIRAGPLDGARFAGLERLHEAAARDPAGFEDVNISQLQFEAFAAAFARFDDEARVRYWLKRIDNLWPINDKKVEIVPLENFREGRIAGVLRAGGRPASALRVGLFLETFSEVTKKTTVTLSSSRRADARGAFQFDRLGAGIYHLEIQAPPEFLRARVSGSPGLIHVSEDAPDIRLPPINWCPAFTYSRISRISASNQRSRL
ncbi:MAG: hypothetical protein PHF00_12570 [Elusimicrobia bacterium]|nr:hypothetical protein [Elusimicrobiota bacterium]